MSSKHKHQQESQSFGEFPLFFFACPNPDCADFNPPYVRRINRFAAGNLSAASKTSRIVFGDRVSAAR
jgi:hypothetical protein